LLWRLYDLPDRRQQLDAHGFLFVTGLHRSGTSLLYRCLRNHPQISGFQNTGVSEDEGQHLQTVLPRGGAYGGPGRFGRHPEAHMTEAHPLANPETAKALFAQWEPYWDLSKAVLAEKTPITLTRTRLFQALFPKSHFVVIIRHPIAVALATYNALASGGSPPDLTLEDLLEHWLICHEIFLADAPHLKNLMMVKYEEFSARPQETMEAIYSWLGLNTCACIEQVEADINARYLAQWRAMRNDPQFRYDIDQAMRLEERIRDYGYSLQDAYIFGPSSPDAVAGSRRQDRENDQRLRGLFRE
jgi:hypothetical protein